MYYIILCIFSLPPSLLSLLFLQKFSSCSHFYQGENLLSFFFFYKKSLSTLKKINKNFAIKASVGSRGGTFGKNSWIFKYKTHDVKDYE
ncbi:hypothetical protein GcC1_c15760o40 [Golovinomyces cichoracearum]|uniref:Uncharacterized protein n=1 Tax=Golovinomyces cichoracearum TaxID=62708 RepID=A0A420IY69_9PEZI|nr:hypothetical protein GcC1_c15760o40 [Golovinomyces cichoracearum]